MVVLAGTLAAIRLARPGAAAVVDSTLPDRTVVAGSPAALPWPASGQAAVAIPAIGVQARSGPQVPAPVASLTKMMTALVVLHDHPLRAGRQGPALIVTFSDVAEYEEDVATGQARVAVAPGEVLSERQALTGLIVRSGNNLADMLARWDAGSVPAFVAKMNATAARLGMTHTHYADASGLDAASTSTPADQLKVAAADLAIPAFAEIAAMPSAVLPVAGRVDSFTPLVGVPGVVGVKSGFTSAAGGCDVLALSQRVAGRRVVALAAVTGVQGVPGVTDVIAAAGFEALRLAAAADAQVVPVRLVRPGEEVAEVGTAGRSVPAVATSGVWLPAWPGQVVRRHLEVDDAPRAGAAAGTLFAREAFAVGDEHASSPVRLGARLPSRTVAQRLF